jgi:L-idonate 5-dehydrogenase
MINDTFPLSQSREAFELASGRQWAMKMLLDFAGDAA